ncbi:hypothetical protein [Rhodoblastus sp.]|uniref:hypothetical protein n=1 Tax=Rhodoblastus sp. TaxID=1962975 RepID=UPI003F9D9C7F
MGLALADLDRDELLALAIGLGAGELPEPSLRAARIGGAKLVEQRALNAWREASGKAATDAQAARRWAENHGQDDRFRALFEISKKSARRSAELFRAYKKAFHKREAIAREMRILAP